MYCKNNGRVSQCKLRKLHRNYTNSRRRNHTEYLLKKTVKQGCKPSSLYPFCVQRGTQNQWSSPFTPSPCLVTVGTRWGERREDGTDGVVAAFRWKNEAARDTSVLWLLRTTGCCVPSLAATFPPWLLCTIHGCYGLSQYFKTPVDLLIIHF